MRDQPSRLGVPRMWLLGGIITWSKFWVNIAAAKKATARSVSLPVFFETELAGPGDDILRLFRRVGVPAEALAGLDLVNDDGGRRRAMPTIDGEGPLPVDRLVSLAPDFAALQLCRVD